MGLFRYEAIDRSGNVVRGVMNAANEQQVTQKLGGMGYSPKSILNTGAPSHPHAPSAQAIATPRKHTDRRASGMQSVTLGSGVPVSIKPCVSPSALGVFFRQMATLVRSGRPLYQSIGDLMVHNGKLKSTVPYMQERIQSGDKLSSALANYPGIYPVHTVAKVWCGELAGRLDVALDEIASDFEQEASEVRFGKIGWFLTKLTIISAILLLPLSNLVDLLLPVFKKTIDTPGASPQDVGKFIFQNYIQTMFWKSMIIVVAVIAIWIIYGIIKRVPVAKRALDGMLLAIPVWGTLHRYRALAQFTHVLDGLYAAGIPPTTAWEAASLTVRNSALAEKLRLTRSANVGSSGVAGMFAASGVFDPDDVGLATAGEKSGQLPDVLGRMATVYADKAAAQRTAGRTVSLHALVLLCLVLGGYLFIRLNASWLDLAFKAADAVGQ